MPDQTPNLAMPYILPSQAQKHITHNEALQKLDAVVQLVIVDLLSDPPPSPLEGQCYAIGAGATGTWSGKDFDIAFFQNTQWIFLEPKPGWVAWFASSSMLNVWSGTLWQPVNVAAGDLLTMLGINTSADLTSRLAIASPSSLFSHEGGSHRLKINKANVAETASMIFQDAWSGRAEIGLNGTDKLSFKVSPDGTNWATAMEIEPNGVVRWPGRPAVRASYDEIELSRSAGAWVGFTQFHVNQGGFMFGDLLVSNSGLGFKLIVPVSGVYMITLCVMTGATLPGGQQLILNGALTPISVRNSSAMINSVDSLVQLNAGDALWVVCNNNASYKYGSGKSELTMVMI